MRIHAWLLIVALAACSEPPTAAPDAASSDAPPDMAAPEAPALSCGPGERACDGRCVDVSSDRANCGVCGRACSDTNASGAACVEGRCAVACNDGWGDCDGSPYNGCEASLALSTRCGACGVSCAEPTPVCSRAAGGQYACASGCSGATPTRCGGVCVDTRSNFAYCGSCERVCPAVAHGRALCASGTCEFACDAGFRRVGDVCVVLGGVRSVAPESLGDTTLTRPTLRWALPSGADGAVVELCRDRACTRVIETLRVRGESARPSAPLPARSVVFWRARARVGDVEDASGANGATWLFHTPTQDATSGADSSFNTHLDVNGDGFDDLVVTSEGGRTAPSRVDVYMGSAAGISARPTATFSVVGKIARVGDVNGDGYADLAVGDSTASAATGRVAVYFGSAVGLAATPAVTLVGPDGPGSAFGGAVAGAGDVNGDGYDDLLVGAEFPGEAVYLDSLGSDTSPGKTYVFFGGASGPAAAPDVALVGPDGLSGRFGNAVVGLGDVNGDRHADFAITAPFALPYSRVNPSGRWTSRAYVYLEARRGGASSPAVALNRDQTRNNHDVVYFPFSAGDIDGDGYADSAVGTQRFIADASNYASGVQLWAGSAAGLVPTSEMSCCSSVSDGGSGSVVFVARGAGDTDGDGYSDLIVGSSGYSDGLGRVQVYFGSRDGLLAETVRSWIIRVHPRAAAGVGDVNGDGYADVAVVTRDRAWLYLGSAAGPMSMPAVQTEPFIPGAATIL